MIGRNHPEGEPSQMASLVSRRQGTPQVSRWGVWRRECPSQMPAVLAEEVGRRKHGELYLKVLALNSQDGLEGASQEEIQARNRPRRPHPG